MSLFALALAAITPAHADCTVAEVGPADFGSLQEAIDSCDSMPIRFLGDVHENVIVNRTVTIDGDGHVLHSAQPGTVIDVQTVATVQDLVIEAGLAGSGVRVRPAADLLLSEVIVRHGQATQGGGIFAEGVLTMTGSRLDANTADLGGGMYVASGAEVHIIDSKVINNEAEEHGAGVLVDGAVLEIDGLDLNHNVAGSAGGGLGLINDAVVAADGLFAQANTAGTYGAGIAVESGELALLRSRLVDNVAADEGGGMYTLAPTQLLVQNSTFQKNHASHGGGVSIHGSATQTFHHVSVIGNVATTADQFATASSGLLLSSSVFGDAVSANGVADCVATASGSVFSTLSMDGTCRVSGNGNVGPVASLGLLELGPAELRPIAGSPAIDMVPTARCASTDQEQATRLPFPCDAGALEHQ